MTKKQNTIIFILLATVANIALTLLLIILLTMIVGVLLPEYVATILPFVFLLSIILAVVIYQRLVAVITKKFNLEEKMDPLFFKKRK